MGKRRMVSTYHKKMHKVILKMLHEAVSKGEGLISKEKYDKRIKLSL